MAQFNSLIVTGGARFLNTIKGTIENSEKVGGHSTPASGNASSDQVVLGNDTRLTNSRTPTSHTHGNIQNGGTLQTNDITIASGDKIVVTDSSDSAKVARTSISFDGSTATKALTQKGTWETFGTSNLTLGTTSTTALKGDTKYAGSSSAGGSATSAVKLDTATAGSATQPCYFTSGKPSACTYSLNKTVPSDAVFTDTTYESKAAASGGTAVSLVTTGEKYTWNAKLNSSDAITRDTLMPSTTTYSVDNLHGGTRFVYSTHGTPSAGTIVSFDSDDSNNYGLQLSSSYNAGRMWYRTRNGDTNTWHNWIEASPRYEYDAIGTASSKIYYIPVEMRGANTAQSSYLLTCPETDGGGGLYFLRPNASTAKMEIYTIVAGHSTVTQTTDTWGFIIRTSGSFSTKPSIIRL